MRLATAILTASALILLSMPHASADDWGALKWPGTTSTYPDECLHAGLIIGTGSPPKHEVEAVNTCRTDLTVDVLLNEYNSSGIAVESCFQSDTNRAQCHLQDTTPRGDYWAWQVVMANTGDSFSCSEQDLPFGACFTSAD